MKFLKPPLVTIVAFSCVPSFQEEKVKKITQDAKVGKRNFITFKSIIRYSAKFHGDTYNIII